MKRSTKIISILLLAVVFITAMVPCAFAKEFAVKFDGNIGIQNWHIPIFLEKKSRISFM